MENLINILNGIKRGAYVRVASYTKVRLMKPKSNPFAGKEVKKFAITTYQFGLDYEGVINNRLEREGKEGNFEAEKNKVGNSVEGMEKRVLYNANTNEYYGQFYCTPNPQIKSLYFIDGKLANKEEIEEIKAWSVKTESKKQSESGLSKEKQIKPRSITLSNIIWLKCGEYKYHKNAVAVAR